MINLAINRSNVLDKIVLMTKLWKYLIHQLLKNLQYSFIEHFN